MVVNVMRFMYPLHSVSKLFAVSHINTSMKLSVFWVLYSLSLVIFMNSLSVYQLVLELLEEEKSKLFKCVSFICILSPTITRTTICVVYIIKHKFLVHFLGCISDIESVTQRSLKVRLSDGVYIKFQYLVLFLVSTIVGVHAFLRFSTDGLVPGVLKTFTVVTLLSQVQFVGCVLLLSQYISVVTDSLTRGDCVVINTCRELIRYISVMKEDLNSFFSIPILLAVANNMLLTTFSLYMLIKQKCVSSPSGVYHLYTASMNAVQVMTIALSCAAAGSQIQSAAALAHQILNTKHHLEAVELVSFSKQILHIDITFTAGGFFTLNESLITSVFAAICTQLVILLQFQMSSNSQENSSV